MASDEQRRRDRRVGCVLEVEYRSTGHLLMSYCTNLSRGGLFVCTSEPMAIGEGVTVSLSIPDRDDPIKITGTVRWVRAKDGPGGPAGMGLSFEGIDEALGHHVDFLVEDFAPLSIEIVGDPGQAWQHIAALTRSLVECKTNHRPLARTLAASLSGADLVIVDVDADPEEGIALLEALAGSDPRPPTLALCSARAVELRRTASQLARVVATPVDSTELQGSVLQTLSQVRLSRVR